MKNKLLISFLLLSTIVNAQLTDTQLIDYLVIDDSVQLLGEARYDLKKPLEVEFKRFQDQVFTTYPIHRVHSFRQGAKTFFNKDFEGQPTFFEMLVYGKISLFIKNDTYLIVELHSKTSVFSKNNYKNILTTIYKDGCNWDYNYENLKFKRSLLLNLVHGYNLDSCYKIQKSPIGVHLYLGSKSTTFNRQASPLLVKIENFSEITFFGGIQKEFATHKKKSLLLTADLLVSSISSSNEANELELDQKSLLLGLGPKYYIKKVYVGFGVDLALRLSEISFVRNGQNFGTLGSSSTKIGFHATGGLRIVDTNKITASIEARYTRWNGSSSNSTFTGIGFFIGI